MRGIERCVLTRNRSVMVSFRGNDLRLHAGYCSAPIEVHQGIVAFVNARTRRQRADAGAIISAFRVPREDFAARRAVERTHPDDEPAIARLTELHRQCNAERFGRSLSPIQVRVSRRMKARLGHYASGSVHGDPPEIVISRRHIRRHGWPEAILTLLHEMVHQWQDESGMPIDHRRTFRRKCREIGIEPSACRDVIPGRGAAGTVSLGA